MLNWSTRRRSSAVPAFASDTPTAMRQATSPLRSRASSVVDSRPDGECGSAGRASCLGRSKVSELTPFTSVCVAQRRPAAADARVIGEDGISADLRHQSSRILTAPHFLRAIDPDLLGARTPVIVRGWTTVLNAPVRRLRRTQSNACRKERRHSEHHGRLARDPQSVLLAGDAQPDAGHAGRRSGRVV